MLEKISVSPDHPVFEQFDGVLYEKATRTLICCPAGKAGDTFAVPDGTLTIGDYAFACCNSLTTVTLPEGLASIGDSAFSFCESLTAVTLPDSLTSIGKNPFSSCSSLAKIDISPDHPVFAQIDGVLYEKESKTLICCPARKEGDSFAVPDGILAIGDRAFYGCETLTTITLPKGLTSIGDSAFSGCTSLTSVTLPNSLTSIGDGAFFRCDALTSVSMPKGLTAIGDRAFACCESLTSVTLPDSLVSIGEGAFKNCPDDLTLIVPRDSYACQYAIDNGPYLHLPRRLAGSAFGAAVPPASAFGGVFTRPSPMSRGAAVPPASAFGGVFTRPSPMSRGAAVPPASAFGGVFTRPSPGMSRGHGALRFVSDAAKVRADGGRPTSRGRPPAAVLGDGRPALWAGPT